MTDQPKRKPGQQAEEKPTTKRGRGQPPFEITVDVIKKVEQMAGFGLTVGQICTMLGCSEATFHAKKAKNPALLGAYEKGKVSAQLVIGSTLFQKAKSGDLGALVWWEKTRVGRSEPAFDQCLISESRRLDNERKRLENIQIERELSGDPTIAGPLQAMADAVARSKRNAPPPDLDEQA